VSRHHDASGGHVADGFRSTKTGIRWAGAETRRPKPEGKWWSFLQCGVVWIGGSALSDRLPNNNRWLANGKLRRFVIHKLK
jgi:hypothetical protein